MRAASDRLRSGCSARQATAPVVAERQPVAAGESPVVLLRRRRPSGTAEVGLGSGRPGAVVEAFAEEPLVGALGARVGGEARGGDAAQRYDGLHGDEPRAVGWSRWRLRSPSGLGRAGRRRRATAATSRRAAGGRRWRRPRRPARGRGSRGTRAGRAGSRRPGAGRRAAAESCEERLGPSALASISARHALTSSSSSVAPSSSTAARHRSDGDGSPSSSVFMRGPPAGRARLRCRPWRAPRVGPRRRSRRRRVRRRDRAR